MSSSSNISQSAYSQSEPETPQVSIMQFYLNLLINVIVKNLLSFSLFNLQNTPIPSRILNFDQSLNHSDIGNSFEQSLKNAHKELHQKRIQNLRKELDYLKSTEWKFEYEKGFVQ